MRAEFGSWGRRACRAVVALVAAGVVASGCIVRLSESDEESSEPVEPELEEASVAAPPAAEGEVGEVRVELRFRDDDGDLDAVEVEAFDDTGASGGSKLLPIRGYAGEKSGTLTIGGPHWLIRGAHHATRLSIRLHDRAGGTSPVREVELPMPEPSEPGQETASVGSKQQAIHDCPAISNVVGGWAAGIGGGSPFGSTRWCGGSIDAQGLDGDPINCWDECCRLHDYCFGRPSDRYTTCHQKLGSKTTDCIHACDKQLEACWNSCNAIEDDNQAGLSERALGCADGSSPQWCEWYRMDTCNADIGCTRPMPPPEVGPPARCCAEATVEECASCEGRDWGCGVFSNWDEPFPYQPVVPEPVGCGEPCRGNLDCGDARCGVCGPPGPDGVRRCSSQECGAPCTGGDEDFLTSCWGAADVDIDGNVEQACESCVIAPGETEGACLPRGDGRATREPDDPGQPDAGAPDAGSDAGVDASVDGGSDAGGSDGSADTDAGDGGYFDSGQCPDYQTVTGPCGGPSGCVEGFYCSTQTISCVQEECPPGAGRTYTLGCCCDCWGAPLKNVHDPCRPGFLLRCEAE